MRTDSAKAANASAPAAAAAAAAPPAAKASGIRDITNGVARTSISAAPVKRTPAPASTATPAPTPAPAPEPLAAAPAAEAAPKEEEEDISYEEAVRRAEAHAQAVLQCSIDNKDACLSASLLFSPWPRLARTC